MRYVWTGLFFNILGVPNPPEVTTNNLGKPCFIFPGTVQLCIHIHHIYYTYTQRWYKLLKMLTSYNYKFIWIQRGDHVKLIHPAALGLYREEHTAHCSKAQYHFEHQDCFHLVAAPQHRNGNKRANNPANSTNGRCNPSTCWAHIRWIHLWKRGRELADKACSE
jgi:hypothetical protein